ncbi:MAG: FAD-dependent oxidoreductase, partial [Candidatus Omnitrophica bacterium]|nr:FAD-dependent oxidoreductase [Candidatus Omnitrophota bacterium]MBD3268777.1 FAD-dependent oxidoreductase [Candidatus Omnitrophota bacterium]
MYDVAIVGAGASGISCAREVARRRRTVVLIENNQINFGGICLNKGCI